MKKGGFKRGGMKEGRYERGKGERGEGGKREAGSYKHYSDHILHIQAVCSSHFKLL